ncbi:Crp/Fnr family transcriptional regulator [Bosea sp. (in: a-proteobacteria)]|uniref:Crp/Fnr family transcriptional regulator n=1 Tax=Bosea sp. (in: a-proteobacteria) TaxID=1871050 RepID=UPI002735F4CB|nr:Crp/Fnr family transcriptional regulator [Bosea sp. (in: a-proteobacteria)]MDP3258646.1 Crp/Fnr family transcriptional regulator [Bosea sp. (in: a-proteobacteria)]
MIVIMSATPAPVLAAILARLPLHDCEFSPGAALFHRGDGVVGLHIMPEGTAHLIRHQDDGAALILQRARPGAVLAEASLYSARYHCDARAETCVRTGMGLKPDLLRALETDVAVASAWASYLAHEVQRARLLSEILSLKTVKARLKAWIAWNGALPPRGQGHMIGTEIGVTVEAFYREIARERRAADPAGDS